MIIIGIDPGAQGGFAWNEPGKGIQAAAMPATEAEIVALLRGIQFQAEHPREVRVFIEKVGGYVKPPKIVNAGGGSAPPHAEIGKCRIEGGQPGSAMFKFGRNAGVIVGACLALGITPEEIEPQRWQKPLFIAKGLKKPERKRLLKDAAQRRFPQIKVTLKTADALLIRSFGEIMSRDGFKRPVEETAEKSATLLPAGDQTRQDVETGENCTANGEFARDLSPQFRTLKETVAAIPVAGRYVEASGFKIIEFPDGTARPATSREVEAKRAL